MILLRVIRVHACTEVAIEELSPVTDSCGNLRLQRLTRRVVNDLLLVEGTELRVDGGQIAGAIVTGQT